MRFCLTPPFFAPSLLAVLMASTLMMGTPAQATPAVDELDNWLANKGLLSQMSQASQSVTNKASELVVHAMGFLGVPYQRGGGTFETGFDCSGFVKAIFEQTVGLVLPRKAEQQAADTQRIDKKELVPGDLVFFNTMHRAYSHVGIYVGDGKFIHSPKPGAEVRIESLGAAYWNRRFDGARRVGNGTEEMGKAAVVLQ
jgi:cell wall-associated NlpC family hydrolase